MSSRQIYQCQCANCLADQDHPDQELHHQMNLFLSRLNEAQRRWYVALEAKKLGRGGAKRMAEITGLHVDTIRRGRRELDSDLAQRPAERVRVSGGGRQPVEKKASGGQGLRKDHRTGNGR